MTAGRTPRVLDHPVRLRRIRLGLGAKELADRAGVSRSTVTALEDARTTSPRSEVLGALAKVLGMHAEDLEREVASWRANYQARPPRLSPTAKAHLAAGAAHVREFRSFRAWRQVISPTSTNFASVLGVSHMVVSSYERGIRMRGMSSELASALVQRLGLDNDTLVALQELEPSHD